MKSASKTIGLLSVLMVGAGLTSFLQITNGVSINTEKQADHESRLHSLFLDSTGSIGLQTMSGQLSITNGVVIGSEGSNSSSKASIGGGDGNKIIDSSNYAGIGGGAGNTISNGANSIIGGGYKNDITGANAIIAGGNENKAGGAGNVLGGSKNSGSGNGVVLGGQGNTAGDNSLALGSGANAKGRSFAWSATADNQSARIDAANGVLIGTTQAKTGVNLLVNGAVKLGGSNTTGGTAGEIKVVSGCFYAYDGAFRHIVNQNSTGSCSRNSENIAKTCQFGNIQLQEGDTVTGYKDPYSTNCQSTTVTCSGGALKVGDVEYKYPFCYNGGGE